MKTTNTLSLYQTLAEQIIVWARELGFQQIGITDTDAYEHSEYLKQWLAKGFQGEMDWIQRHQPQRENPALLVPNALRVISARIDYLPENTQQIKTLKQPNKAYISRYALGRDYHKLIRKRLAQLGKKIENFCEQHPQIEADLGHTLNQRPFVDSAPVLEKAFGEKAGLGWIGKHTLLLNENAGSWFFLGELITNLPLPLSILDTGTILTDTNSDKNKVEDNDTHQQMISGGFTELKESKSPAPPSIFSLPLKSTKPINKCGDCTACLKVCPTDAFIGPYQLDARRCISYLTIELKGSIPIEFREPMGNRVFGCDDCQLICPWNKWAKPTQEKDFSPRHSLDITELTRLFLWSEEEYLKYTEGSAIRRLGFERWLRNLAIGLGNADPTSENIAALESKKNYPSAMVQEHIDWALNRLLNPKKRIRKVKNLNK
jgi:epoxyqueuosine reductase